MQTRSSNWLNRICCGLLLYRCPAFSVYMYGILAQYGCLGFPRRLLQGKLDNFGKSQETWKSQGFCLLVKKSGRIQGILKLIFEFSGSKAV